MNFAFFLALERHLCRSWGAAPTDRDRTHSDGNSQIIRSESPAANVRRSKQQAVIMLQPKQDPACYFPGLERHCRVLVSRLDIAQAPIENIASENGRSAVGLV